MSASLGAVIAASAFIGIAISISGFFKFTILSVGGSVEVSFTQKPNSDEIENS